MGCSSGKPADAADVVLSLNSSAIRGGQQSADVKARGASVAHVSEEIEADDRTESAFDSLRIGTHTQVQRAELSNPQCL